jgi:hypothetical protein
MIERKIQYVIFDFSKAGAGKAHVKIISIDGTKTYTAAPNGQIKLKLDQKLIAENPEVELSGKPKFVAPDFWERN